MLVEKQIFLDVTKFAKNLLNEIFVQNFINNFLFFILNPIGVGIKYQLEYIFASFILIKRKKKKYIFSKIYY